MRVLVVVTRAEQGGAAQHVRDLVAGLRGSCEFGVVTGEEGYLTEQLRELDLPLFVCADLVRQIHPLKDLRMVGRMRRIIRDFRPDIVHAHTFKAGFVARLVARLEKIPCLYTPHAWPFVTGVPKHWQIIGVPLEAALGRIGRETICVSRYEYDLGRRLHVLGRRQGEVILNGIPDTQKRAEPGKAGVPHIIMVARFSTQKAQDELLAALAGVVAPFRLSLVGDGPTREAAEQQAVALGLKDKVRFLGTRNDVEDLLSDADLFVLATNWESFPLSILEAMRAGLPVVATDVGGIREAVDDGRTGFLVGYKDTAMLCDRLKRLLDSAPLRADMGEAGRRRYETHFRLDQQLERTLSLYRRLKN